MKKIILATILLSSCAKQKDCNCGLIESDDASDYSIVIKNHCSGNNKTFYLQEGDWMNAHPGQQYCIENETEW